MNTAPNWYAIATKPKHEDMAVRSLQRLALETFVPMYSRELRRRGRRLTIQLRLFPGYVFVRVRNGEPWRAISECFGVHGVVCFGNRPERIPDHVIGDLVTGEITGAFDRRIASPADAGFLPGVEVKALDGVFAGHCGRIVAARPDERLLVLFSLLGKPAPVEMPLDALELAAVGAI